MEGWAGFTDEDLRKLKGDDTSNPKRKIRRDRQEASNSASRNVRAPRQQARPRQKPMSAVKIENDCTPIQESQMLSRPKPQSPPKRVIPTQKKSKDEFTQNDSPTSTKIQHVDKFQQNDSPRVSEEAAAPDDDKKGCSAEADKQVVTDDEEIISLEMKSLQKFQDQQKMIEELNKKKKLMLATAIQQRQKKAKAEAAKLSAIQRELNKLDQMVNADVAIIRDRIETASRDYLDAQKRYDRAEKEFIAAKIDVHDKEELKDNLTEHLYAVIHQNELRKAKKLAELMGKLEMEEAEDISELRDMALPQLSLLNQVQVSASQSQKVQAPTLTNAHKGVQDSVPCPSDSTSNPVTPDIPTPETVVKSEASNSSAGTGETTAASPTKHADANPDQGNDSVLNDKVRTENNNVDAVPSTDQPGESSSVPSGNV